MTLPLAGLRILVTRPADQAGPWVEAFEALGAEVAVFSAIRTELADAASLAAVLGGPAAWWVFTSVNGVRAVDAALDGAWPLRPRLAAVGPSTADALLAAAGRDPDLVPTRPDGAGLAMALLAHGLSPDDELLLPRGNLATRELPEALTRAGFAVQEVEAYRTWPSRDDATSALAAVDWVTFASGSAARALVEGLSDRGVLGRVKVASVGPRTSEVLRELGVGVDAEAGEPTAGGVGGAIAAQQERSMP